VIKSSTELSSRDAAKKLAAGAFDCGIRAANLSNEDVSTALGVGKSRVARLRSDDEADLDVVPNLADLILMKSEIQFEETIARIRSERVAIHGPPQQKALEDQLLATLALDSRFHSEALGSLRDRVVDATEVPEIESALDESDRSRETLRGMLRRRARR
jgi:hypothetical protein